MRTKKPESTTQSPNISEWFVFERAVDVLLQAKPQHKTTKKPAKKRAVKKS